MKPRPDPANLVASNIWIMDTLEELLKEKAEECIPAAEAARRLGHKPGYFHGMPWRIPGFGLQGTRHALGEWRSWNEKPEAERRAAWDAIPLSERRMARGNAA